MILLKYQIQRVYFLNLNLNGLKILVNLMDKVNTRHIQFLKNMISHLTQMKINVEHGTQKTFHVLILGHFELQ